MSLIAFLSLPLSLSISLVIFFTNHEVLELLLEGEGERVQTFAVSLLSDEKMIDSLESSGDSLTLFLIQTHTYTHYFLFI